MNEFSQMISEFSTIVTSLVCVAIAVMTYIAFRNKIDFLLTDWRYRLPIIGGIAKGAKNADEGKLPGWRQSEETLASDYKKHIHLMTPSVFNNAIEYMKKSQDGGRSPLPAIVVAFISLLVIAEGLGFSYLLGTWMARDGSANIHTMLMFAIVLVICGIMVWITHAAGHQLYRTNLIRSARKNWEENKKEGSGFGVNPIALKDEQSKDDSSPPWIQSVNRVGTEGGYSWMALAVGVILIMAVTMTVMRWNNLKVELNNQTTGQASQVESAAGNPFAKPSDLPAEVVAPQKAAEEKARKEVKSSTETEGMAAFIMLAFIFIVTQIVGISAGYRWGFAGNESKAAYKMTEGFATFDAYIKHYGVLLDLAEARLTRLQQEMVKKSRNDLRLGKTFRDFLTIKDIEATTHISSLGKPLPATAPASVAPVITILPPLAPDSAGTTGITYEVAMSIADNIADKEAKKHFLQSLSPDIQKKVLDTMTARTNEAKRQEEEAKKAAAATAINWDAVL